MEKAKDEQIGVGMNGGIEMSWNWELWTVTADSIQLICELITSYILDLANVEEAISKAHNALDEV